MTDATLQRIGSDWDRPYGSDNIAGEAVLFGLRKIGAAPLEIVENDSPRRALLYRSPGKPTLDDADVNYPSKINAILERLEYKQRDPMRIDVTDDVAVSAALDDLEYLLAPSIAGIIGLTALIFSILFFSNGFLSLGFVCSFGATSFLLIAIVSFRMKRQMKEREWAHSNPIDDLQSA